MFGAIARRLFGTANDRVVKGMQPLVAAINAAEPEIEKLSDDELRARTAWLKERLEKGETLDDLLVDAFATVREAAKRTLGQRHFDVQLIGGIVLHRGMISEMKTGEGKTLVATLPVYLNALAGKGVHVVTVNDYLAKRDAEWMGRIYNFLGLSVGCIVHGLTDEERRAAYAADVTYGTNNEYGFDYLRDNMKFRLQDMVQRPFTFAIVDEVDSILIDEARTPLIISGPSEDSSELYIRIDKLIPKLGPEDFEKDEKQKAVTLTEAGVEKMENLLNEAGLLKGPMYDIANISIVHHVNQALRAHKLFHRDTEYLVKDGKVVIVDEFTGRAMEGRRWSEGLHQAVEAKEGVQVQMENQTLASITFQNYFRLYPKLAGMTGTAMTEAGEFAEIYKLEVVEIPTNRPMAREDNDDEVYRTFAEKTRAIVKQIEECRTRQQPVLVGTVSIEKSELLSAELKKRNIPHQVLNARYHEQEAYIVAQAGRPGAVTIATNMAGRGTDIQLGGNVEMRIRQELAGVADEAAVAQRAQKIRDEVEAAKEVVKQAGGLYIIGTERHESRRIEVLPVARRRPHAHLRLRAHGRDAAQARPQGGRGDHPSVDQQGAREGAAEGRGAQLRDPQADPEIRRRHERPAQGRLRAAQGHHARQRRRGTDRRHAPRGDRQPRHPLHPRERLRRAVGSRHPARGIAAHLRPRPADRGLGEGRRHRRRGDPHPHHRRGRPQDGGEGCQCRPRDHAHGGEVDPAADPRPGMEGPPAAARSPAPGHRPARLRPARPAQRVQARGIRAVRGHAARPARAGDELPLPCRDPRAGPRGGHAAAAPGRSAADARGARGPGDGGDGDGRRQRRGRTAPRRQRRRRFDGQSRAQRPLPLRFRQEVQALPRAGVGAARRGATQLPRLECLVTFLAASEGGRSTPFPPGALSGDTYRPHIVVGDPRQRQAIVADGNRLVEEYVGVAFHKAPTHVEFGAEVPVELTLMYYPHPMYDKLVPGASFTIREGAKVVGFGTVLRGV